MRIAQRRVLKSNSHVAEAATSMPFRKWMARPFRPSCRLSCSTLLVFTPPSSCVNSTNVSRTPSNSTAFMGRIGNSGHVQEERSLDAIAFHSVPPSGPLPLLSLPQWMRGSRIISFPDLAYKLFPSTACLLCIIPS